MNTIELSFFAVALLLPLVGGGALLYFLARDAKKHPDAGEATKSAEGPPPAKEDK